MKQKAANGSFKTTKVVLEISLDGNNVNEKKNRRFEKTINKLNLIILIKNLMVLISSETDQNFIVKFK